MVAHGQRIRAAVGPVVLLVAVTGPGWAATVSGPPLLWRVAGCTPGPSYVFAILHSADARVTTLPRPVRAALNASARLVMEVLPTSATLTVLSAESFDPDGPGRTGLASRLGPGLFAATACRTRRGYRGPTPVPVPVREAARTRSRRRATQPPARCRRGSQAAPSRARARA